MTFFKFFLICIITVYGSSFIYALIERAEKKSKGPLLAMVESGVLDSPIPICKQIELMINEVEIEDAGMVTKWDHIEYNESKSKHIILDISPGVLAR